MKWGRKKSSSLITRIFPVSWFSKFKRNSPPQNSKNSVLDFPSPNSSFYREGRFYSMDEDDAYWRISFSDDRIQPRRSTGGINPLWQDSDKDLVNHIFSDFKRFGLAEAGARRRDECRNFSEMVSDIKRMRESRGKQRVRDERETRANGGGEREISPIESKDDSGKPRVCNSRKPAKNPKQEAERGERKLKVIKTKTESKGEGCVRKRKESRRSIKAYSPRSECKIRALQEMKKARTRPKKKPPKERLLDDTTVFDSFAVVKSSLDPQRDFKDSMVQMIREKGIGHPDDLQELLACYLTLNYDEYHDLIISVFRQVSIELKGAYLDMLIH